MSEQLADYVDDYDGQWDMLLLMWDQKSLQSIAPPNKVFVAWLADSYVTRQYTKGLAELSPLWRRRLVVEILKAPVRTTPELALLAIETARLDTMKTQELALTRPFRSEEDVKRYADALPTAVRNQALQRACKRYLEMEFGECVIQASTAFKNGTAGQREILRAWLTPSSAHHSDQEESER